MAESKGTLDVLYGTLVFHANGVEHIGSLYRFTEEFNNGRQLFGVDVDPEAFNSLLGPKRTSGPTFLDFSVDSTQFNGQLFLRVIKSDNYATPLISPTISLTSEQFDTLKEFCVDAPTRDLSFTALM